MKDGVMYSDIVGQLPGAKKKDFEVEARVDGDLLTSVGPGNRHLLLALLLWLLLIPILSTTRICINYVIYKLN